MRIILFTGKGGVGKTSVAAATACRLADSGKRVLIMSTDAAHSLGDSLDVRLGAVPTPVADRLDAMELDVVEESEQAWGNLRSYIRQLLTSRAEGGLEAEELLVFPGLEELFSLLRILDIHEQNNYDVLVVDCAPTGETLSLLKFPEMFASLFEKVMPMKRKAVKVVGPVVEAALKIPMPRDDVFGDLERLMDRLERLQRLLHDQDTVSMRIVTTPERIVIQETKRNYTWLHLYDYNVDAVIVNKVYPSEALEGYFNQWVRLQATGLADLKDSFRDLPLFTLPLERHELRTLPVLRTVAGFYGDSDAGAVLARDRIFRIVQDEGMHRLEVSLPLADKRDMELACAQGELHLTIRNEKRCFALPDALKGRDIVGARLENGLLQVDFAG